MDTNYFFVTVWYASCCNCSSLHYGFYILFWQVMIAVTFIIMQMTIQCNWLLQLSFKKQ